MGFRVPNNQHPRTASTLVPPPFAHRPKWIVGDDQLLDPIIVIEIPGIIRPWPEIRTAMCEFPLVATSAERAINDQHGSYTEIVVPVSRTKLSRSNRSRTRLSASGCGEPVAMRWANVSPPAGIAL